MKKIASLLLSFVFGLSVFLPNSMVFAEENAEDYSSIYDFFETYQVEEAVQQKLIEKLKNGEAWDSLKENTKAVETKEFENNDGTTSLIEVYEDGSIVVTSFDDVEPVEGTVPTRSVVEPGGISTFGVSGGSATGGTGYRKYSGVKVYYKTGVNNASFKANFTIQDGGYDSITKVYDSSVVTIGGSPSDIKLSITRAKETSSANAQAKLSYQFTTYADLASWPVWIKLNVGGNKYWETHN